MIELQNISMNFDGKSYIKDLSCSLGKGSVYLVKGPSGCGKSTLLQIINGLYEPDSGKVLWNGEEPNDIHLFRSKVVYCSQLPVLYPGTLEESLLYPFENFEVLKSLKPANEDLKAYVQRLLPEVEMTKEVEGLSVGQKQRVAIIRALLLNPDFVLMDEPAAPLDDKSVEALEELLQEKCKEGVSFIITTHRELVLKDCKVSTLEFDGDKVVMK